MELKRNSPITANPEELLAHADFVRQLARSLIRDDASAADIAQQTWVAALEHPPAEKKSLRGWLFRVTRNFARKFRRDEARRRKWEWIAASREKTHSTDEVVEREEVRRRVVEAVLNLQEPYRSAILFRYYQDMRPREVAEHLGLPLSTVKSRLQRGLELLRARLDARHGGDRTAWFMGLLPLSGLKPASPAGTGAGSIAVTAGVVAMSAKMKLGLAAVLIIGTVFTMWQLVLFTGKDTGRSLDGGTSAQESAGSGVDAVASDPSIQGTGEDTSIQRKRVEPQKSLTGSEEKFMTVLVLEEWTETPIEGVRIGLHEKKDERIDAVSEVLTGADGRCRLSLSGLDDAGYLFVTAFKPGYTTDYEYVDWDEEGWIEDEFEFRLIDGTPLAVKVLEASGRRPVKDTLIHFYQDDVDHFTLVHNETDRQWQFKTDEEGCCLIPAVKEDRPYDLKVYHPAYAQVCRFNQFCKPGGEMLILLGAGGCIGGTVYNDAGTPFVGASVRISEPGTMDFAGATCTGMDGSFRVMGLQYGKCYLVETEVENLGYHDASILTDKLQEKHGPYRIDLTVRSIKTVLIVDVYDHDGRPTKGLNVRLMEWNDSDQDFKMHKEGETDGEGRFRCFPLISGPALVEIGVDDRHCLARHCVNIMQDNETRLQSEIPSGKNVRGIMRMHDGRPAVDFRVYLVSRDIVSGAPEDWLARLRSRRVCMGYPDEEGRFLVENLSFERLDLYVAQSFYDPEEGPCSSEIVMEDVRAGAEDLDIALPPPGTIKGRIVCDDRPDKLEIYIQYSFLIPLFSWNGGWSIEVPLDPSGGFSFDLPYTNRDLRLGMRIPGYPGQILNNVRLESDTTNDLGDLVFSKDKWSVTIRGCVTDSRGNPVRATIRAGDLEIQTNESGVFYAKNVLPDVNLCIDLEEFSWYVKSLEDFPDPMDIRIIMQRPVRLFVKVSDKHGERKDLEVGYACLDPMGKIDEGPWFNEFDEKLDAYAFLYLKPGSYRILVKRDSTLLDKTLDVALEDGEQKKVEIILD